MTETLQSDTIASGPPRRIAVIGGGIAGMSAAHDLARDHAVTLFEAEPRLGGHARTVMAGRAGDVAVDTGFIVFNEPNYPGLTRLFRELDVPVTRADMSFSVSLDQGGFEYAFREERPLRGIFAQKRNMLRPRFWRMLRDVLHFNAHAKSAARDPALDMDGLLTALKTGPWLRDRFLLPFAGAIWSTPTDRIWAFPAETLVDFLDNHGLLTHKAHPQWYTVQGGSRVYVDRLGAAISARGGQVLTGHPVEAVRRDAGRVDLRHGGAWQSFDAVVFAVHADAALRLLTDPSHEETQALSAIRFTANEAVLHSDPRLMPRRRAAWAAWNHRGSTTGASSAVAVTYWMNALQVTLPRDEPLFLTLNPDADIAPDRVYDRHLFHHPAYDHRALAARRQLRAGNGAQNTWFCGAWLRNGFHEDGVQSAADITKALRGVV